MDFEFKRMDFNDMFSLAKYGEEVLEEARRQNGNGRTLIDVSMNDEELKNLIKSIPTSIDGEIEKNIDEDMPITLNLLDKILSNKLVDFIVPNFLTNKVNKKVIEAKDNCENNNSVELYNTIMSNIDSIRFKMEDEYHNTETVVNSLAASKEELIELSQKFDIVIETGIKDLEEYQNSEVDEVEKVKKVRIVNERLLVLRNVRASLNGFIQEKDIVAADLFLYLVKIQQWLDVNYPILSHGVEVAIEAKYVNNKSKQLKSLIDTSNDVILDSAKSLKESTQINVQLLEGGSLDYNVMNNFLKTVNEAVTPIQQFIDGKDNNIKKLMTSMDKIETEISKTYQKMESVQAGQAVPSLEKPKVLRLEKKND